MLSGSNFFKKSITKNNRCYAKKTAAPSILNSNMSFLSYKPGHDGTIAYVKNGSLEFSIEAEKDSNQRYAPIGANQYIDVLKYVKEFPDVVCMSGWFREGPDAMVGGPSLGAGYQGISKDSIISEDIEIFGKPVKYFSSSHERSHILCAYGLSPFPQGQSCYALIWEGFLGTFYEIDEHLNITRLGTPMTHPGVRYSFIYNLANPAFSSSAEAIGISDAGKLMALAAYSKRINFTPEEKLLSDKILFETKEITPKLKEQLKNSPYHNIGLEDQEFRNFAGIHSNKIYEVFFEFAKKHFTKKQPLIIAGGCGLNCDWNTMWRESGLVSDVFVPPVANDTGSAIGTAIDAQFHFTKNAKIDWDPYVGLHFNDNALENSDDFDSFDLSNEYVAELLAHDLVIAWVQDRYEIGPRALGNRSLLAAPFKENMRERLNSIKKREQFRPIAPICLESDAKKYFNCQSKSPWMLDFFYVNTTNLAAVTHVNNTARIQTVSKKENSKMYDLLMAFKKITGYGVLCNTSLNFKGTGFINNSHDLINYVKTQGIDGFVVGSRVAILKKSLNYQNYLKNKLESSSSRIGKKNI